MKNEFEPISRTLKESQIDDAVAAEWLKELVNSYTKSLELSNELTQTHMIDLISIIKKTIQDKFTRKYDGQ